MQSAYNKNACKNVLQSIFFIQSVHQQHSTGWHVKTNVWFLWHQSKASRHFAQPSLSRLGEKKPTQKRADKLKKTKKTNYGKIILQTTQPKYFK